MEEDLGGVIFRGTLVGGEGLLRLELKDRDVRLVVAEDMRWLGVEGWPIGSGVVSESEDSPNVLVSSLVTSRFLSAREDEALAL